MSPAIESSNAVLTSNFVFNHLLDECRLRRNLMPTVNLASIVTALGEQWPTSAEDSDAASWIAKGRRYFRTGLFKAITRYSSSLAVTALSDNPAPYFYLTMLGGKPQAPFDVIQTFYVWIYHLYQRDKVEMIHHPWVETGLGDIAVETFNYVCSLLLESRRLNSQRTPSQPNQGTESVEDEPEGDYSNAVSARPSVVRSLIIGPDSSISVDFCDPGLWQCRRNPCSHAHYLGGGARQ
ncbi:hypothetical protein FB45DRAFT_900733, partial [Roridomyces roridus]